MKKIKLTQGFFALVDDEDYEWLSQWKWHYQNRGYARRNWRCGAPTLMHRLILDNPLGEADHINGNKLDNRRSNLRVASHSQNQSNSPVYRSSKSGLKGVRNVGRGRKAWQAIIQPHDQFISLGYYATPEEAAVAYNHAAKQYYGNYARLNVL